MPTTVYYHKSLTHSGTEELFAVVFEFWEDQSEVHAISTYASNVKELRRDIENWVKYCSKIFLNTETKKDFFKEWEYKFIDLETEEYLQYIDGKDLLI